MHLNVKTNFDSHFFHGCLHGVRRARWPARHGVENESRSRHGFPVRNRLVRGPDPGCL